MFQKALTTFTLFVFSFTAVSASCIYDQAIKGENLQIGTMLTWSTSFEENNSMFIVEKSEDGVNFAGAGSVKAAGNIDEEKQYNYLDVMANSEKTMYRLKQVDFDGSFSFSDVVTVAREFKNDFMVARMSSVTTTDIFEVTIDALKDGEMNYNVANLKGELMFEDNMLVVNGLNELNIDLTDQNEGIYKLNLEMDGEKETLVVKRVLDEIVKKQNVASKDKGTNGRN